jgi:hypothetical protein
MARTGAVAQCGKVSGTAEFSDLLEQELGSAERFEAVGAELAAGERAATARVVLSKVEDSPVTPFKQTPVSRKRVKS